MTDAGPADRPSGAETPTVSLRKPRLNRRSVLGAAVAGAAGIGALRLLALEHVQRALPGAGTGEGRPDWLSPLGSEPARVMHLLRRTTFGAMLADFEQAASEGYSKTVDRLLETKTAPPPPLPAQAARNGRLNVGALQQWWVDHMLRTPTPFAEQMTLFWHGHFTSDYRKVGLQTPFMYWQNLGWREMALGDLRSMLLRVTADPAMLRYLDLATSTGRNPNENYARELLELFTMGVGSYGEEDVRSASQALAGWTAPNPRSVDWEAPQQGTFARARAYNGGPLTFLGRRDAYDTGKIVDRILGHQASALHLARKVVQQFVATRVDEPFVRRLAERFRSSRYDVKTLMREVLLSPEFLAGASYRALVKSPVEFMVHALKALGAPQLSRLVVAHAPNMGHVLFDPPDVNGWPSNEAWVSSNNVMARVNFVTAALAQLRSLPAGTQAPRHVDTVLGPQTARLLSEATDDRTRWFLTLASPEFQLK